MRLALSAAIAFPLVASFGLTGNSDPGPIVAAPAAAPEQPVRGRRECLRVALSTAAMGCFKRRLVDLCDHAVDAAEPCDGERSAPD